MLKSTFSAYNVAAGNTGLAFPTPPLFDAPSGGTPCDINIIYTSLKSTFNGLQFRCWLLNLQNSAKFRENSNLLQAKIT